MTECEFVWVFCGSGNNRFPSAVFQNRGQAESWIAASRLTGTLTAYPVGVAVYAWAVERGLFKPTRPEHTSPSFVGNFSSAHQEHYHYENGQCGG